MKRAKMNRTSAAWRLSPTPQLANYLGACSPRFYSSSRSHSPSGAIASGSAPDSQFGRLQRTAPAPSPGAAGSVASGAPTVRIRPLRRRQNASGLKRCRSRRNSGRVYGRHSCPRRLLGLDHRRRQDFPVRTFGRRQRALDPRPEGNHRPGGKLRWHRLSLQRKEGRHWGNVRRGQERYFWPWRNVTECPIAAYEALTLSLFFFRLPPPSAVQCRLGPTECQLPPALPIRLRLGGHLWYRFE